jgi:hypothetical protein
MAYSLKNCSRRVTDYVIHSAHNLALTCADVEHALSAPHIVMASQQPQQQAAPVRTSHCKLVLLGEAAVGKVFPFPFQARL